VIAVIDETAPADRGGIYYVVSAAILLDADATRLGLRSVLREGRKRPFHWADEGPAARARMLDLLMTHGLVGHVVVHYPTGRRRQEQARRLALEELVPLAIADGAQELIIESRATREDDRDRGALIEIVRQSGAALSYRWEDKREPLLWLADAVCGVVKEYLLDEDTTAFDRLRSAHVLGDLRYRRPPDGNA
jgi:uncharacterized membrane protein